MSVDRNEDTGGYLIKVKCNLLDNSTAVFSDASLGDSIAVNGVCLTVREVELSKLQAVFGLGPETLRRTTFANLSKDNRVNLERAIRLQDRLGGHIVQGHIDCTATIVEKYPEGDSLFFAFEPTDRNVLRYIIEKGFIAVDGASLTVNNVSDKKFSISLVKYSQMKLALTHKSIGDSVNLEVDQIAKYCEKLLAPYSANEKI